MQERHKEAKKFNVALKVVSGVAIQMNTLFFTACCSATFHKSVSFLLSESSQYRIEIQLSSLNGKAIFSAVSHNCFYYTSKPECAIPDNNIQCTHSRATGLTLGRGHA
jgi:hypothetical protein